MGEVWAGVKSIRVFSTWRTDKIGGALSSLLPWELCTRAKVFLSCCLEEKCQGWGSWDTLLIRVRFLGSCRARNMHE